MSLPASSKSLLFGVAVVLSAGCQGQPTEGSGEPICVGSQCDGPVPPISGSAIVDCWVTPGEEGGFDTLDCRYEPPVGYPIVLAGATVSARTASGDDFSGEIESGQAGQVLSMGKLSSKAYPFELSMDILFDNSDRSLIALDGLDKVTTKLMIESPGHRASDRPVSAHIPFDLWEVNLLGRDSDFSALSFGYDLDVGAERLHRIAFKSKPLLFGRVESFYLPVDINTWSVDAKIVFEDGEAGVATMTGPGNYAVRDGLLLSAEDEDLPQEVRGGSILANCWFQTEGHGFEQLFCRAEADQGIKAEGTVIEVVSSHDSSVRVEVGDEPTLIATLSPRAFPIDLALVGQIEEGIVGLEGLAGRSLRAGVHIDGKILPRAVSRLPVRAPYSIWQVTVDNQSEGFQGNLDTYVLELGDGMFDRFATLVDQARTPFVAESSVTEFSVATPAGVQEVNGNGFMLVGGQAQEIEFVLRPGTLVVGE